MGLLKSRLTQDEQRLVGEFTISYVTFGFNERDASATAERVVLDAIAAAKHSGRYGQPPPSRDDVLKRYRERERLPTNLQKHADDLNALGATDADLIDFWQRSSVEFHALTKMHDALRLGVWMQFMDQGLGKHEAAMQMRRTLCTFGFWEPELPPGCSEADRDIPWELNYRVMSWLGAAPAAFTAHRNAHATETVNASVRHLLRAGSVPAG